MNAINQLWRMAKYVKSGNENNNQKSNNSKLNQRINKNNNSTLSHHTRTQSEQQNIRNSQLQNLIKSISIDHPKHRQGPLNQLRDDQDMRNSINRQSLDAQKSQVRNMLTKTLLQMQVHSETKVISGLKNMEIASQLKNHGHVKRLMNSYMQQDAAITSIMSGGEGTDNDVKHDKRAFIPFVDERDQLGRLIQNEMQNYQQFNKPYVRKVLIFRPRKVQDKIEFGDEIPRRWKESGDQPVKNQEYYDSLEREEIQKLKESFAKPTVSRNIPSGVDQNIRKIQELDNQISKDEDQLQMNETQSKQKLRMNQTFATQRHLDSGLNNKNLSKTFYNVKTTNFPQQMVKQQTNKRVQSSKQHPQDKTRKQFQVTLFKNNFLDQRFNNTSLFNSPVPMKSVRNQLAKEIQPLNSYKHQKNLTSLLGGTTTQDLSQAGTLESTQNKQNLQRSNLATEEIQSGNQLTNTRNEIMSLFAEPHINSSVISTQINQQDFQNAKNDMQAMKLNMNQLVGESKLNIDTSAKPQRERRQQFRVKVFDQDQNKSQQKMLNSNFFKPNPFVNRTVIYNSAKEEENPIEINNSRNLAELIMKNYCQRSGTASFKSSIDRSKNNVLIKKQVAPPLGQYDYDAEKLFPSRFKDIDFTKLPGRVFKAHPDQQLNYKQQLESFDYSSFKQQGINSSYEFGKLQPRDDVSFLKHLARFQMAQQLGMEMFEFEQLWKIDKQGVFERLLMLRKS